MQTVWLPFELHPEAPPEGIARERYFGAARLESMDARLLAMGREVGLAMKPPERIINSRLALSTAEFAREREAFEAVHRALFKAHWEDGARLDSVKELRAIAVAAGLDGDELEAALDEGRYEEVLDANRREAVQVGIDAIPAHIFGRRFLVVGAHPLELFEQVVNRVATST